MASESGEESSPSSSSSPSNIPPSSPDEDFPTNPLDFSIKIQQNANAMVSGILTLSYNSPDQRDIIDLDARNNLGENKEPEYSTEKY